MGLGPAAGRLTKRSEFLAAAAGRRFHTATMSFQGLHRPDGMSDGGLRVGFTVTKRVGHATERNRIRRRLRTVVRDAARPFGALPCDVVIIGRQTALSVPYQTLVDDVARGIAAVTRPGRQPGPRERALCPIASPLSSR